MTQHELFKEFVALPSEAQRQVIDFVVALRQKYEIIEPLEEDSNVADDKFIGMWSDHKDLTDSSGWVRSVREDEWSK